MLIFLADIPNFGAGISLFLLFWLLERKNFRKTLGIPGGLAAEAGTPWSHPCVACVWCPWSQWNYWGKSMVSWVSGPFSWKIQHFMCLLNKLNYWKIFIWRILILPKKGWNQGLPQRASRPPSLRPAPKLRPAHGGWGGCWSCRWLCPKMGYFSPRYCYFKEDENPWDFRQIFRETALCQDPGAWLSRPFWWSQRNWFISRSLLLLFSLFLLSDGDDHGE